MSTITKCAVWCLMLLAFWLDTAGNAQAAEDEQDPGVTTVEFPIDNPPSLGDGWSIIDGRRKLQTCISFKEARLAYEDKRANVGVAEDYEALSNP